MDGKPVVSHKEPSWWTGDHSSAWERAKVAMRRDWEQTKADLSSGGHELNQSVGDTLKQAAGKEAIPPGNVPNLSDHTWSAAEPGLRFGFGARSHHGGGEWNDKLEAELRQDWESANGEGAWERIKASARRGWEASRRAL
jgi:hypothetical protein